jgi:hypothetical protein
MIALYALLATGAGVDEKVMVRATLVVAGAPKTLYQSAGKWRDQVADGTYTAEQLAAATPLGYRLPTIADARASAVATLTELRLATERAGWWVQLDLEASGAQWWQYSGDPPEIQARVTGALSAARDALALGAPDGFPFRCRSQAQASAGAPPRQHQHTVAQLSAVQLAGAARLAEIGETVDAALAEIESAEHQGQIDFALSACAAALAELAAPPV